MSLTLDYSGTETPTVGTPVTLATDTNNGTLVLVVDVSAMQIGDEITLTVNTTVLAAGTARSIWSITLGPNSLPAQGVYACPPTPSDISSVFVLSQSAGTARAFPWKVLRA